MAFQVNTVSIFRSMILRPGETVAGAILYKPTTSAATPTVPTVTAGPLGATGTATAQYSHGDGMVTGFASPLDAIQRALILIENDRSVELPICSISPAT